MNGVYDEMGNFNHLSSFSQNATNSVLQQQQNLNHYQSHQQHMQSNVPMNNANATTAHFNNNSTFSNEYYGQYPCHESWPRYIGFSGLSNFITKK